jgi:formylglycine-generating enzyme required for sulfatase activity
MRSARFSSNKNTFEEMLVTIPAGSVAMRDDRTNEKWSVSIESFVLMRFPVTQAFYKEVMGTNPSTFEGDQLPVETVSWIDAVTFCNQLSLSTNREPYYSIDLTKENVSLNALANGYRLPTEAEWQYACQAGNTNSRYGAIDEIAWYKSNADHHTHVVGQKQPNKWGLYDMLGNVWEWCSDIYDESVYGSYRVFRGGGWCDQERSVMATTRRRSHPFSFRIDDLGFRIAANN